MKLQIAHWTAVLVCALTLTFSCGWPQANTSGFFILGGYDYPSHHPAAFNTVGIARKGELPFCTGSLVTDSLVVTAAHCFVQVQTGPLEVVFTHHGSNHEARRTVSSRLSFSEKNYFPNFDVAWVRFEGPIPDGFYPLRIDDEPIEPTARLSLSGYGVTATWGSQLDGKKRATDVFVTHVLNSNHSRHLLAYDSGSDASACFGDSGGPAYRWNGQEWLIHALINGKDPRLTRIHECEEGRGILTQLKAYAHWIETSASVDLKGQWSPMEIVFGTDAAKGQSFAELCRNPNVSEETWWTIEWILKTLRTWDCSVAQDKLNEKKTLNLGRTVGDESFPIVDLTPFASLQNAQLTTLILTNQNVSDLSALKALPSLENLNLRSNAITTTEGFSELTGLRSLNLADNQLQSVRGLGVLESLNTLELAGNSLKSLVGIERLVHLETLTANSNSITEISALVSLPKIRYVILRDNLIEDLSPLEGNKTILNLDIINNPISETVCPLAVGSCRF